jgi:DNA sulfur modification protein DndE
MKKTSLAILIVIAFAFKLPPKQIRIFMIGDSTMADKPLNDNPERGWGQLFPQYFTEDVLVKNYAVNGRSTKSFIKEGRWDSVMKYVQKNDYVFIQFGHNDEKTEDSTRYAAPKGLYRENLIRFIKDARSKGANPIMVTPVMRRKFDDKGKFTDTHGEYPDAVRAVAKEMNVPLIDLHVSSQTLIEQHGVEGSKKCFFGWMPNILKPHRMGKKTIRIFLNMALRKWHHLYVRRLKQKNLPLAQYLRPSAHPEKLAYELPKIYQPNFKRDTFNIVSYDAKADGTTLNTTAINQAITECLRKSRRRIVIDTCRFMVHRTNRSAKQCRVTCRTRSAYIVHHRQKPVSVSCCIV